MTLHRLVERRRGSAADPVSLDDILQAIKKLEVRPLWAGSLCHSCTCQTCKTRAAALYQQTLCTSYHFMVYGHWHDTFDSKNLPWALSILYSSLVYML